jgi:serine/threonine-protein kinase
MDSSPVDEAWDTEGADDGASVPPPSAEDHDHPAQAIADLRHPHLVVMRRTEGAGFEPEIAGAMSLSELSRSDAGGFPLPLRVGLRILLDALSGLAAVHEATQHGKPLDFVHGGVAPSNIFIGRDGVGRLVPVLPAHWSDGAPPSPDVTGYMAPERLLGDVAAQPADVFSAGVLLWEAITGKPLFRNWPLDAIVTQLIGRKVPYPIPFGDALWGVPLADVAMRALAVDPIERWPDVSALGAQIQNIARGHLASSDEIAALVAGFAAGMGPSSIRSQAMPTIPLPAPTAVTSLSPTASSIQSPPESRSMEPVEVPAVEPAPVGERWEALPAPAPRIWAPTDDRVATERSAVVPSSIDLADSWSGITPPLAAPISRRTRALVLGAVVASFAITGIVAYRVLDRSPETTSTGTVLAPKAATPGQPSAPRAPGEPAPLSGATPTAAGSEPSSPGDAIAKSNASPAAANLAAVPTAVTSAAPTSVSAPPAIVNRPAPRSVTRPAAPAPTPAVAPSLPRPAAPAPPPPPPAAKPKPKEDLFGI